MVTLPLSFPPNSPGLHFIQQYPREHAEAVAHCALLYGVRCLIVQASTSGALTLEQLKRLSGYTGPSQTPSNVNSGLRQSLEAEFEQLKNVEANADADADAGADADADAGPEGEAAANGAHSPPRVSRATRVAASAAIRGAAQAWEVETDGVSRGLRQRRVQPPPRPAAAAPRDRPDSSNGSNAALEQQLHALEAELAELKASVGSTDNEHKEQQAASSSSSAAVGRLVGLSLQQGDRAEPPSARDEDAWQADPASDRDSIAASPAKLLLPHLHALPPVQMSLPARFALYSSSRLPRAMHAT